MRGDELTATAAVVLGALGTYLLLPHGRGMLKPKWSYALGAALSAIGAILLASFWTAPGPWFQDAFFYGFGLAAIGGGVMTITSRDPIYSALWFASVVLSTSGLFLMAGAQFLAAGTVIVYAGAIIVTFLFVIMLAQAEGRAVYDRAARAPGRATLSCFLLLWCLLYALIHVRTPDAALRSSVAVEARIVPAWVRSKVAPDPNFRAVTNPNHSEAVALVNSAVPPTARLSGPTAHVAGLGGALYTDHLIAVEVAGAILFVALVGAAAIATPKRPVRPGAEGR
jgi:NADH-quinone oxidoreductase subunit J